MTVLLCILDGWGCSTNSKYDAINRANTPYWDSLLRKYPNCQLATSGTAVGLPDGQMGNSEVGHMTIGSGRIIEHSLTRINKELPHLANNDHLMSFAKKLQAKSGTCHIMGLLSPGGVHSHMDHITALQEAITAYEIPVKLHAFLDGRDTPPQSALQYIKGFDLATICGRYYAMDRDQNWERTQPAYDNIMLASGTNYQTAQDAIQHFYQQGITDEFMPPAVIGDYRGVQAQDGIIIANFRPDRIKQMLQLLLRQEELLPILGMVEYDQNLPITSILEKLTINNTLGQVVADHSMKQLRIAETEKYAHVTYFFNGGMNVQYEHEERILVPSPKVQTYDLQPEMSAPEMTERLLPILETNKFDLIILNYANPDMVGHTGNIPAAIEAICSVDHCLSQIIPMAISKKIDTIITADHGNAECMYDEELSTPNTAHTTGKVPLILVSEKKHQLQDGNLSNIAPTILQLLKITPPSEMDRGLLCHDTHQYNLS